MNPDSHLMGLGPGFTTTTCENFEFPFEIWRHARGLGITGIPGPREFANRSRVKTICQLLLERYHSSQTDLFVIKKKY